MKTRKFILTLIITLVVSGSLFAQEETTEKKVDTRPVRSPFENEVMIDNYTVEQISGNALQFMIQHRFGKLNNEEFDLLGIYAAGANIRLGLNYGITDRISVGFGTMKNDRLQDLNWKWAILQQTRGGNIPLSISYYGNIEYDAREKENFGKEYATADRVSYYHEIMFARKFSDKLSIEVDAGYSHFNQIDTTIYKDAKHANIHLSALGRYKFAPSMGVIAAYNHTLTTPEDIKSSIAFGLEIGTSGHAFQIFLTSADAISRQSVQTKNRNDFTEKDLMIGFNITRLWYF